MYKVSSGTLNLYSSPRDSQTFVTGHSVQRYGQKLQTSKHGQAHTIQMVYERTRAILLWPQLAMPAAWPGLRPV